MDPQTKTIDPQLKSIMTSIALAASTSVAAWAANKGLIPGGDQSVIANALVTAAFSGLALAIGWYKQRQQSPAALIAASTPTALIEAVNAQNNGVKVVPSTSPTPCVNVPLK